MTAARRRRLALAALSLGLATLLVAGAWRVVAQPLSATERAFAGAWEMRFDAASSNRRVVWEFRPDRTCVGRHFDRATGAELGDADLGLMTWRLRAGRLVIDYPEQPLSPPRWKLFAPRHFAEAFDLTADGTGRFRFAATQNPVPNAAARPGALIRAELGDAP